MVVSAPKIDLEVDFELICSVLEIEQRDLEDTLHDSHVESMVNVQIQVIHHDRSCVLLPQAHVAEFCFLAIAGLRQQEKHILDEHALYHSVQRMRV